MKNKHFNIMYCDEITNIRYFHKFKYYGRVFVMVRRKDWSFIGKFKHDIHDYLTGLRIVGNFTNYQQCKIDAKEWISRNVDILNQHELNETKIINK